MVNNITTIICHLTITVNILYFIFELVVHEILEKVFSGEIVKIFFFFYYI